MIPPSRPPREPFDPRNPRHHRRWEAPWTQRRGFERRPPPTWDRFHHPPPEVYRWHQGRQLSRREDRLFLRFALTFGCIQLFLVGGLVLLALTLAQLIDGEVAFLTWVAACSLPLSIAILVGFMASRAARNITHPLAEVMSAADAVAYGDLNVRVQEDIPGEFGKLALTFNRMVGELQRIDEQRRNLTADVAHELRTPLHVIQGNLEGILDGVYQPTNDHIQLLLDETRLLSRLVDDLRTLSLAESGHLPLHPAPIQMDEFLRDLATSFEGQAKDITLDVQSHTLADVVIEADVMRLNQVMANLMVNALRHTPAGGSIIVWGQPDETYVRLLIKDMGQGIPPEQLAHIYDRFWRGDASRSRTDGSGAGLGLAIVRQLVELHGGQVNAQSRVGQGTTFVIDLPKKYPQ